ncbi:hypothetical protein B0H19DRAFT_1125440 [Mycena capillaripes]|nr:hypothetical protein B0H19DRAFT_1125440 [Mycena capillaripes]
MRQSLPSKLIPPMPSQHRLEGDLTTDSDPASSELSELSHWERLIFSFDMNDQNRPNPNTNPQGQSDPSDDMQTAALLAQLAASSGNMFPSPHEAPYSILSQRQPGASGFNPGPSNPRPFVSPANLTSSSYGAHSYPLFRGALPPPPPGPQSPTESTRGRTRAQQTQAVPSTSNAADDDDDNDEYEDKRRRNTAASARFRIKKKQRTLDLERSVSDLTGRAEELEREASDLRRENGWLKEIVMLKGGRLAGIDLSGNMGYPDARGQSSGQRGNRRGSGERDGSDSEQSEEDRAQGSGGKSKGKGKGTSKKK